MLYRYVLLIVAISALSLPFYSDAHVVAKREPGFGSWVSSKFGSSSSGSSRSWWGGSSSSGKTSSPKPPKHVDTVKSSPPTKGSTSSGKDAGSKPPSYAEAVSSKPQGKDKSSSAPPPSYAEAVSSKPKGKGKSSSPLPPSYGDSMKSNPGAYRSGTFNGGSPTPFTSGSRSPSIGPPLLLGMLAGGLLGHEMSSLHHSQQSHNTNPGSDHAENGGSNLAAGPNHNSTATTSEAQYFMYNSTLGVPIKYTNTTTNLTENNPGVCICIKDLQCGCGPLNTTVVNEMPASIKSTSVVNGTRLLIINGTLGEANFEASSAIANNPLSIPAVLLIGISSLLVAF